MSLDTLQNFYKDAVKIAWTAGAGNFYVTTKPVPTSGYLVINPSNASKREIVRYTGTGTDANGDYVTIASVSDRGLGGTTAQAHAIDEPIRMNITAEHWASIQDAIDELGSDLAEAIFAGAAFGSTTTAGIGRASASPDSTIGTATISIATPAVISRTAHGLTVNDRVKFTTDGALPTGIVASTDYYVIATGLTADEFQISATLGGAAINTSGSQSGTHTLIKTTPVFVTDTDTRLPTTAERARIPSVDEEAAIAGSLGTPNNDNKFVTQNNLSEAGTDQSQTTQNSSIEVGESNTTLRKNKIAQSFIPTKNKIRGVILYKSADTGAFTGTVKVALQADSGGNPSGSDLASYTMSNTEWLARPVGEVEFEFSSEYASLLNVPDTTYWIVVETSTSDNSNRVNLGFNTAGGYANGTLKCNNTTDGWVEVTGDDLYFKTLEGVVSQVVKTDPNGFINPIQMKQFNRSFITVGTRSLASTSDITITHNLGYLPSRISMREILSSDDSFVESQGIALINKSGTITYAGMAYKYDKGSAQGGMRNFTNALSFMQEYPGVYSDNDASTVTIKLRTKTTITLSVSKTDSPAGTTYYFIEIIV